MPVSAMAAGADMAAVSMHKSGGSLTQTTGESYLLLTSLDISGKNMALRGKEEFRKVTALAEYARAEIHKIGGCYSYTAELINGDSIYDLEYIEPKVAVPSQSAFYAEKESLSLKETKGRVCSEFVMCYPSGIPILAPGEEITDDILKHISYVKDKGCAMTGPEDPDIERLNVLKEVWA